jgi:uncharacterized membrane protein
VSDRNGGVPAAHRAPTGVERIVRLALLVGIGASVALMAAGLVLVVVRGQTIPSSVTPAADLPHGLVAMEAAAYLSLGLMVLIATPFVRVMGSIVGFAREGDRRYVLVTSTVFALMCLGVLLGRA